jgi:hypothetical protein
MANNFQKSLLLNEKCIWEIIKLYHPDILDSYPNKYKEGSILIKNRLKVTTRYDWIVIELHVQTHIKVSLGIKFECHLMSGNKPLHLFQQELDNNIFRCWRFYDDSKHKDEKGIEYDNLKKLRNFLVTNILSFYNISKPTAKQMSNYYHSN